MRRHRILSIALCALMAFSLSACGGNGDKKEPPKPAFDYIDATTLSAQVSPGTQALYIDSTRDAVFEGAGAEIDPYFHTSNIGHKGVTAEGKAWEVVESDWENYVIPRMQDMKLQRTRVMLQTAWYAKTEAMYTSKNYAWDTTEMNDFYLVLDTCEQLGVYVNVTLWGITDNWMGDGGSWVQKPKDGREHVLSEVFADAIRYLLEVKKYTCIGEVTLYCEPSNQMKEFYQSDKKGFEVYCDQVRHLDTVCKQYGIRDKIRFNMSDDANNHSWLEKVCIELGDVVDLVNSHQYRLTPEIGNTTFRTIGIDKTENFTEISETYGIPVLMGEFGINNEVYRGEGDWDFFFSNRMGLDVMRAALNYIDAGVVGVCYWTLFSQVYGSNDRNLPTEELAPWGLWAYKDTDYKCRGAYYSYSLFTRLTERGSTIYKLSAADEHLVGAAFRTAEGKWSYLIVNDGEDDKKVAFCNSYESAGKLDYYEYNLHDEYKDAEQIQKSKSVVSNDRIAETVIPACSFVVLTNL